MKMFIYALIIHCLSTFYTYGQNLMNFPNSMNVYEWTVSGEACLGCPQVWFTVIRQPYVNNYVYYEILAYTNSYGFDGRLTYTVIDNLTIYSVTPFGIAPVPGIPAQTIIVGNQPVKCAWLISANSNEYIQLRWSSLRIYQ